MVIDWKPVNGDYDRLPQAAAELVRNAVDVIVAEGTVSAQAATRATSTIPIVMATVADPVGSKIVSNLAHPGGNVTGLSMMIPDLEAKRLQLVKELLPHVSRVAVLWNSDTPYHAKAIDDLKATAPSLGMELSFHDVRLPNEFSPAISAIRRVHAQAVYVIEDPFFFNHRSKLVKLALSAHLPAIFGTRAYAEAGGLMSYGVDYSEGFRRSAEYVDKILKGAKPGELPIEQPTKFELLLNLRTAKALAIPIPASVLLRADEVIR